jgi:DUF1680 family protein
MLTEARAGRRSAAHQENGTVRQLRTRWHQCACVVPYAERNFGRIDDGMFAAPVLQDIQLALAAAPASDHCQPCSGEHLQQDAD